MTLDKLSNIAIVVVAVGALSYSVYRLATARNRSWPFWLAAVLFAVAISALAAAATFMRDTLAFQIMMAHLAEGFGIATLVVLAAAAMTGRVPNRKRLA